MAAAKPDTLEKTSKGKKAGDAKAEAPVPPNPKGAEWEALETELIRADPKTLRRREINARYMEPAQFRRLVENVRTDGKLTSTVLCFKAEDGQLEILSGHHRSEAAIEVGLKEIDVEVILTKLSDERKVAIQLSHNAISGKDNPSVLANMYGDLTLDWKKYSGLTDDDIGKFDDIKLDGLGAGAIKYEELVLTFLPEDLTIVEDALKRFAGKAKFPHIHVGRLQDFDRFFEAMIQTKIKMTVHNSALALLTMAELALERLTQLEDEQNAESGVTPGEGGATPSSVEQDHDDGNEGKR